MPNLLHPGSFSPGKGLLALQGGCSIWLGWLREAVKLAWKKYRNVQMLGNGAKPTPLPGIKQCSGWSWDTSCSIFSSGETQPTMPLLLAAVKVPLITTLPASQQVLINTLFIFHVIQISECKYSPAEAERLQELLLGDAVPPSSGCADSPGGLL